MIDDLRNVLETVSTPADVAVVLTFGTAGFLVDAAINAVGFLEPSYVGLATAIGALGVKKGIEAGWSKLWARKRRHEEHRQVLERANALMRLLEEKDQRELMGQLDRDMELFVAGVVDVRAFRASVTEVVGAYRSQDRQMKSQPNTMEPDPSSPVSEARFQAIEVGKE